MLNHSSGKAGLSTMHGLLDRVPWGPYLRQVIPAIFRELSTA